MNSNDSIYGLRSNGGLHGDVYTSPDVVRFMLDKVCYTEDRDLSFVRILEPSCGDGEFVVEIARRLMISAKRFHFNAFEVFQKNVRAYEIDKTKIEKCRMRLYQMGVTFSEQNIIEADFLKSHVEKTDIVVGNPPYIRYENIPMDMLLFCKHTFPTFHYRCDLYVPFFEKTLSLLYPEGKHCFICSNRWLKNEYGKKLRSLIAKKFKLNFILNLEQADAFQEEVLAYPAITLITREIPNESFEYAECEKVSDLNNLHFSNRKTPKTSDWTVAFNTIAVNPTFLTIEQQGFRIGIGVATGADSIFISRNLPQQVESELIMPGINAKDLRGDCLNWQGEYLLNPYNSDGSLVNLKDYPRASAYLESHKERLTSRHVAQKSPSRWYKTIDRIIPTLLSQPKILLPDLSGNTYVFVDDGHFYPLHNIYYIVGHSSIQLRLLAAFLMSDFIRKQLSAITNHMNGGFPRWQSQHLRKLRLPDLNSIPADNVQELLSLYENKDIASLNSVVNNYLAMTFN